MSGSEEDTGTGSNGKELGKEKAGGVNLEITKRKRKRATAKRMLTLAIQSLGEAISNNQKTLKRFHSIITYSFFSMRVTL